MARRNEDTKKFREALSRTREEKRNAQRKELIREGKEKRKRQMRREKFYGG